ncbi:MAG: hypothetical protein GY774_27630 [Planctomycetes bacterium]|nr:hypothetical protein [Planctomycetota bacterium]
MIVVVFQIAVFCSTVFFSLFGRRALYIITIFWSVWTVVEVFMPWLMLVQLLVLWGGFLAGRNIIDNIEWKKSKKEIPSELLEKKLDGRVFMVTTESFSFGANDFERVLDKNGIKVYKKIRMRRSFGSLALASAIEEIYDELKQNDVVAIVRGGGDVLDEQFNVFRSEKSCELIKKIREQKSAVVVVGVAHAANWFPIDEFANIVADTPTYAAFKISHIKNGVVAV